MAANKWVPWNKYIGEIAAGIRAGETSDEIADRINRAFPHDKANLTKNSIISAMRYPSSPAARVLFKRFPDEAEHLLELYRGKRKRRAVSSSLPTTPSVLSKFEQAKRELKGYPATPMRFRCTLPVFDVSIGMEKLCGQSSKQPFCPAHRLDGRRRLAQMMANSVVRVA